MTWNFQYDAESISNFEQLGPGNDGLSTIIYERMATELNVLDAPVALKYISIAELAEVWPYKHKNPGSGLTPVCYMIQLNLRT